ncbi:hypothetical protein EYF80_010528 [Liparis tanakae]|uniref:Uncharacterized protein n=1 Tax=Liparis tanakae TaxID=230148 RepID=A0A4Z2IQ38_9TELE|nr:hypothetical protein EYF80_010528 [Liparis tanakae]
MWPWLSLQADWGVRLGFVSEGFFTPSSGTPGQLSQNAEPANVLPSRLLDGGAGRLPGRHRRSLLECVFSHRFRGASSKGFLGRRSYAEEAITAEQTSDLFNAPLASVFNYHKQASEETGSSYWHLQRVSPRVPDGFTAPGEISLGREIAPMKKQRMHDGRASPCVPASFDKPTLLGPLPEKPDRFRQQRSEGRGLTYNRIRARCFAESGGGASTPALLVRGKRRRRDATCLEEATAAAAATPQKLTREPDVSVSPLEWKAIISDGVVA